MASTVGIIGVGNMGSALAKGWLRSGSMDLLVWDTYQPAVDRLVHEAGALTGRGSDVSLAAAESLEVLAKVADIIVVVVKPKDAAAVMTTLSGVTRSEQIVVSAMAGLTLGWLREALGPGPALFRVMPNLAVELGAGAVAIAAEAGVDLGVLEKVLALFGSSAIAKVLSEDLFDVFTAVSGSSPAFLALAIEGLEDGAVAAGLSRADARRVVRGAALQTAGLLGDHADSPAALSKSLLASGQMSAGTAVYLEERNLNLAFRDAVAAAMERSRQMRKI